MQIKLTFLSSFIVLILGHPPGQFHVLPHRRICKSNLLSHPLSLYFFFSCSSYARWRCLLSSRKRLSSSAPPGCHRACPSVGPHSRHMSHLKASCSRQCCSRCSFHFTDTGPSSRTISCAASQTSLQIRLAFSSSFIVLIILGHPAPALTHSRSCFGF